ncbi:lysophospholipid acyltransferase family protein [Nocardia bhagyanarayanae]|uniref:1-acyl-sn-glycerol-3-phosphate acyltransferase n=1 Tax=Nocardia bhagyanarayanae TaxID=1215925 RepID=A0A543FHM4_9NOCA|nr:lysophospholipid acyltransferase family protein [Nocardia bhagyanarayanae]TQM33363.1 1-acyl-sn-glycerol-3-phosphate acyltransferase [Nocardia bhagyanarayanae]
MNNIAGTDPTARPPREYRWPWRVHTGESFNPWWNAVYLAAHPPVRALVSTRYRGIENVPSAGPAIIVCNHVSHVDPLLIARFLVDVGRSPHFLAKREVFVGLAGVVMRAAEQIPIDRAAEPSEAFRAASAVLQSGRVVVIMPEGTITRDPAGMPGPMKTGAARLAKLNPGVPVVPISQWGVQRSIDFYQRRFQLLPRSQHFVTAHPPIEVDDDTDVSALTAMISQRLTDGVARLRETAGEQIGLGARPADSGGR